MSVSRTRERDAIHYKVWEEGGKKTAYTAIGGADSKGMKDVSGIY